MHSISPAIEDWMRTQERLDSFVHSYWQRRYQGPNRRRRERLKIVVMAEAVPLNEFYGPLDQRPLRLFTTDLSAAGAGLVYLEPLESRFVALTLRGEGMPDFKTLAQIVRCTPSEVGPGLYSIGTRFVTHETRGLRRWW